MPIHVRKKAFFFKKKKNFKLTLQIDLDDPLVGSIAQEYLTNREEHDSIAREWTKR
jgi:hypothetical protein